ncbi:hypothetical protein RIF29_05879 [Crotalaria pallida]|uniref:Uncharacterized protein n=1 Tax=Crotalaria pallida TaxID=3830 RepID=A0AAN9J3A5_CROPI
MRSRCYCSEKRESVVSALSEVRIGCLCPTVLFFLSKKKQKEGKRRVRQQCVRHDGGLGMLRAGDGGEEQEELLWWMMIG